MNSSGHHSLSSRYEQIADFIVIEHVYAICMLVMFSPVNISTVKIYNIKVNIVLQSLSE